MNSKFYPKEMINWSGLACSHAKCSNIVIRLMNTWLLTSAVGHHITCTLSNIAWDHGVVNEMMCLIFLDYLIPLWITCYNGYISSDIKLELSPPAW